ncbi:MAG: glycoside hydrolase family 2 TIM barrel-domain containing protein, partial [Chitinophagaceae bacterium]
PVEILYPHIITEVPGVRYPGEQQQPANILVSAHLRNAAGQSVQGILQCIIEEDTLSKKVVIPAGKDIKVDLATLHLNYPKLWWPNGYGKQNLYHAEFKLLVNDQHLSDSQRIIFGVRQIETHWDPFTRSMKIFVNGQPIFIKGGNWIASDAMLRLSPERYDAEIRFHKEMNLNLIRIWGGSLTERPEFYDACDKYVLLVMQDFWISGDCNGRWDDPTKKDNQWVRRQYPDDHPLFIASAADQIRMLRNHPSLAIWCGGNEMTPPEDILKPLRDSLLPRLDGTRWFVDYSNSDSMSYNSLGGNGDGPYSIQPVSDFWSERSFPFNSEVGSVGIGDYASLERFIPAKDLVPPTDGNVDSVWLYHKYAGYGNFIDRYGAAKGMQDFAEKAQLVNYNQYRALIEGFSSHIWQWYTGVIIWKTQNPWTALRGQMYDYYLDPNAGLYGLHEGSEPLHVMYDPVKGMVDIVNNGFRERRNLMLQVYLVNIAGQERLLTQIFEYVNPSSVESCRNIGGIVHRFAEKEGGFLLLRLRNTDKKI